MSVETILKDYKPIIMTRSQFINNSANDPNLRIVGINEHSFFITHTYWSDRRNIKINSEQLKKLSEGITNHSDILKLYHIHKNNLTDVIIEEKGYF
jgi:hypothetical protein